MGSAGRVDWGVLRISRSAYRQMMLHARGESPRECVGLLLGGASGATEAVPLENVSENPEREYTAEAGGLLKALREADERGLEVLAVYHSHPTGRAVPSRTDVERAAWKALNVIIGLPEGEIRAYRLPRVEEVEIVVG